MKNVAKIVSLISLGLVIIPCVLFFADAMELGTAKFSSLIGTSGWFIATPIWMSRELPIDADEVEI